MNPSNSTEHFDNIAFSRLWVEGVAPAMRALTEERAVVVGVNVRVNGVSIRIKPPEKKPEGVEIDYFENNGKCYEGMTLYGCRVAWEVPCKKV